MLDHRWKFGHPDAVQSASLNSLKEEIENSISAVRPLIDDIKAGETKCFEPSADEDEGGEFDLYDDLDYSYLGAANEGDGESTPDVFVTACRDLHEEMRALSGGRRSDDGVVVSGGGVGSDVEVTDAAPEPEGKRRHRLVKRLNTRTIIWLSKYSHSDNATSRMLDRMWSSALK